MNVYQKLQKCRVELKAVEIKESGNNKFAGYTYMELGDFLPHIVDLCDKHGLCTIISFGQEATLTVVNSDQPEEQVVFASPMSTAELKGCHAIQNLGAVETYLRRYLYVAAFDIVEHDALDSTNGKDDTKTQRQAAKPATQPPISDPKDAEYHQRIKDALRAIYGEDKDAALAKVEELTTWEKDGKVIKGNADYRKKTGKGAQILCHQLEKLAGVTA